MAKQYTLWVKDASGKESPLVVIEGLKPARDEADAFEPKTADDAAVVVRAGADDPKGKIAKTVQLREDAADEKPEPNGEAKPGEADGNGATERKDRQPIADIPEGFVSKAGGDLEPGDLVMVDPERGYERLVESVEGMSKGRPRLKIKLADKDDAEKTRRRKLSPFKHYLVDVRPSAQPKGNGKKSEKQEVNAEAK